MHSAFRHNGSWTFSAELVIYSLAWGKNNLHRSQLHVSRFYATFSTIHTLVTRVDKSQLDGKPLNDTYTCHSGRQYTTGWQAVPSRSLNRFSKPLSPMKSPPGCSAPCCSRHVKEYASRWPTFMLYCAHEIPAYRAAGQLRVSPLMAN